MVFSGKARKVREPRDRKRRRVLTATLSALAVLAGIVGAAAPAVAQEDGYATGLCDYAIVVGVRGTNAPGGSGLMHNGRVWSSGGWGDQLQPLHDALYFGGIPYYTETLAYPASGLANYSNSVLAGATQLVNELNYLNSQCPSSPLLLAGHSQGADVILDALTSQYGSMSGVSLTSSARQHIMAVAVFGDPTYQPGKPFDRFDNGTSSGYFPRPYGTTDIENMRHWGYPMGSNAQSWVYTVRSYCHPGDYFCQNNPNDTNWAIHNSYAGEMAYVKQWFDYQLTSSN